MINIIPDTKLDYADVLIVPRTESQLRSRSDAKVTRNMYFRRPDRHLLGVVPIIAANMDTVGTVAMARSLAKHGVLTALHKFVTNGEIAKFRCEDSVLFDNHVFISVGIGDSDRKKLSEYAEFNGPPSLLCVDIANGHGVAFTEAVSYYVKTYPTAIIMAGNVVTGERARQVADAGADIVKVGIGPGSACTTRKLTGVGYPQLSATAECADALAHTNTLLCSDGGCTVAGDVSKALIAGADFVMLGGMLAGHTETGGMVYEIIENGERVDKIKFYGMSSEAAMEKHYGGVATYRAAEGKEVYIPFKGNVDKTIQEILGGIRSTMSYIGVRRISEMNNAADFVKVNRQLNNVFS